jgi:hypothetical protein
MADDQPLGIYAIQAIADAAKKVGHGLSEVDWNPIGEAQNIGTHASGTMQDITDFFKNANKNPLALWTDPRYAQPPTPPPYKVVTNRDKEGVAAGYYTPTNEDQIKQLLSNAQPGQGLLGLGSVANLEKAQLTDSEYATLQKESAAGNQLAMSLLDEYKPTYLPTSVQSEEQIVSPYEKDIQGLPAEFNQLEQQEQAQQPNLSQVIPQVQAEAQSYSGISPNPESSQTIATGNQYAVDASSAIAASTPIFTAALKDLGTAAQLSVTSFPYTTIISDLLNRYAYQIESPSYPAPPINIPGVPSTIAQLWAAATGSQIGGGGITAPSTIGTPDQTGLSTPALTPAVNPGNTGG